MSPFPNQKNPYQLVGREPNEPVLFQLNIELALICINFTIFIIQYFNKHIMKKALLLTLICFCVFNRYSSAQTCTECKQRVIIVYDNEVKIPMPDYASMPVNEQLIAFRDWTNLFYIAGGVRNYIKSDAEADCFQRLDAAFFTEPDSINTTVKSGIGHPNIPPATGSVASGNYIIYGVVTGGGSGYNLQLKLETAKSRELVKEFNVSFAVGFDPITTGFQAASNFGPLYATCLDFEKKKRDEGEPFAIKPTIKVIPEKTKLIPNESTNVEFTVTDCDGVPLKNRTIEIMAEAGSFNQTTLTTNESGKCMATYTAGNDAVTDQVIGRITYRHPTQNPETTYDEDAVAYIFVGNTPNWIVDGYYRFEEKISFEQTLGEAIPLKITSESVKRNTGFISAVLDMKSWGSGRYTTNKTVYEKLEGETMEDFTESQFSQGSDEASHISEYLNRVTTKHCDSPTKYSSDQKVNVSIGSTDRHIAFTTNAYTPSGGGQSNLLYIYCQDGNCQTISTFDFIDCPSEAYAVGTNSYTIDRVGNQDTTYTTVTFPSPGWTITTEVSQLFREDGIKFYFQLFSRTTTEFVMETSKQTTRTVEFVDFVINSWNGQMTSSNHGTEQNNFLIRNAPNPFQTETVISYSILKPGIYRISVFDLYGREVSVVENSFKEKGNHSVHFNASGLKPGIYFCKLTGAGFSAVRKMSLIE